MSMIEKTGLARLVTPLALASYLAWLAVWIAVSGLGPAPGEGLGWPAEVLLLTFLIAWVLYLLSEDHRPSGNMFSYDDVILLILVFIVLGLISLGRSGISPILLILIASALANRFGVRGLSLALLALNSVFAAILVLRWQLTLVMVVPTVVAYGAFQLFAVMVLRYAETSRLMADELVQVNAQLLSTRALLSEAARDQERLRLSRELHDVAGHKLTALRMNLRALRTRTAMGHSRELTQSDALAAELLDDLRAVVSQLRKSDGLSIEEGFRQLVMPMANLGLEVDIEPAVRVERVEQADVLLSVVREGLTNAVRHGRARNAWLSLRQQGDELVLELDDNGQVDWPLTNGMGLNGMRERLESLEGSLELTPSDQGGLRIRAKLPLESPA